MEWELFILRIMKKPNNNLNNIANKRKISGKDKLSVLGPLELKK